MGKGRSHPKGNYKKLRGARVGNMGSSWSGSLANGTEKERGEGWGSTWAQADIFSSSLNV